MRFGQQQRGLLMPGEHGFHRELGQRLHPGENGQSKALGDEELCGFGAPGNQDGGEQDARSGPQRVPRDCERTSGSAATSRSSSATSATTAAGAYAKRSRASECHVPSRVSY